MLTRINDGCPNNGALSRAFGIKFLLSVIVGLFLTTPFLVAQSPGIGGYDLLSPADLSFAYDYTGSGNANYMVFYRPGTGIIYIIQNSNGNFSPVWQSNNGIGGYDLMSTADRIVPFDYLGTGKANFLLCYRPGTGIVQIIANTPAGWLPVFKQTNGIGGYDLLSTADRIVPFDYTGTGVANYLICYRPGTGIVWIVTHIPLGFIPVYQAFDGIGWYDLKSPNDRIVPFDAMGTGVSDHLLLYRPGEVEIYIVENNNGVFSPTYQSPGIGIAGFDLKSTNDVLLPFDYEHSGTADYILAYRPGSGVAYIISWNFNTVVTSTTGLGAYDLRSTSDMIYPFDYYNAGLNDNLVLYRPGTGVLFIESHTGDGNFPSVYENGH